MAQTKHYVRGPYINHPVSLSERRSLAAEAGVSLDAVSDMLGCRPVRRATRRVIEDAIERRERELSMTSNIERGA